MNDRTDCIPMRVDQQRLFPFKDESPNQLASSTQKCQVVAVAKRRDGGTRYWCLHHRADATAKYGKRAKRCRASDIPAISPDEILKLNVDEYQAIALWGAVPAVYDTTTFPMDRGIHVHARNSADGKKVIDRTFRAVQVLSNHLPKSGIVISELDAIYFMVTSVFGYQMKHVSCTYCGWSHLDRDWFSVHPHRRHLCAGCGKNFTDTEAAIGNPICGFRDANSIQTQAPRRSKRRLNIRQADFPGGIQVWGSNPAFLWTGHRIEEEGIHIHAFRNNGHEPEKDDTYDEVVIDGVSLDASMVRILMAQAVLPSIKNRVIPISCPSCHKPHYSVGELAFTPVTTHSCGKCGHQFTARGRLRKTIANPLLDILARLAEKAPRNPQQHDLGLMPETL